MRRRRKIIFLDRDGVINKNPVYADYIRKPSQFRFLAGARTAIRMLTRTGYEIIIISNQTGIGKGLFTKNGLDAIDKKMMKAVKASGGRIEGAYYCIHHPDSNCPCRKPKAGLLKKAIGRSRLDMRNSFFVGDTERDAITGDSIGLKTIAVLSGYAKRSDIKRWKIQPDFITKDLLTAAKRIILSK